MLIRIREWRLKHSKKVALQRIRKHSAVLGHDLSQLSDEALEKGIGRAAVVFSQAGVSADEAAKAFRLVASQCNRFQANMKFLEEQRIKGKVVATVVGHPEWENVCVSCGCEIKISDGKTCQRCSLLGGRQVVDYDDLKKLTGEIAQLEIGSE